MTEERFECSRCEKKAPLDERDWYEGEELCEDCYNEIEDFDFEVQVDAVVSVIQNVTVSAFTEHEARDKVNEDPKQYIEEEQDYRYEDMYDAIVVSIDDADMDNGECFRRIKERNYVELCKDANAWREYQRSLSSK